MKIKYRIIWFEDEIRWLKPVTSLIKDHLEEKGFELVLKTYREASNLTPLWDEINASDLIVMDLKLYKGPKGNDILARIRNHNIFTEVIFYSQSGEDAVRALVTDQKLDGIYCSDREDCRSKVIQVIDMTIKKIQDVNALRGLVMAEESELQTLMATIIWKLHSKKHTLAHFVRDHGYAGTVKHLNETLEILKKINPQRNYKNFFSMHQYGAAGKQMTLSAFLKERQKKKTDFKTPYTTMKTYTSDVIVPRNDLAHSIEIEIRGKTVLLNKETRIKKEFTEAECIQIRKNLRKHRINLENILALIEKGK